MGTEQGVGKDIKVDANTYVSSALLEAGRIPLERNIFWQWDTINWSASIIHNLLPLAALHDNIPIGK